MQTTRLTSAVRGQLHDANQGFLHIWDLLQSVKIQVNVESNYTMQVFLLDLKRNLYLKHFKLYTS